MLNNLFRKKRIYRHKNTKLKRCLTVTDLTLLGIGCIIGTGIFGLTVVATANQAGPAVVLSFVISGLACTFALLCPILNLHLLLGVVVAPMVMNMLLSVN